MRTTFRERLNDFADDLVLMGDLVQEIMADASDALLRGSLESAETALSREDRLGELRARCDQRAVDLLALDGPVARDLRQVVSSIYIVDDLDRMGALAMHIARSARRRHPDTAIPDAVSGFFAELARLVQDISDKVRGLLLDPDVDIAIELAREDDAVDDIHHHLMVMLTQRDWEYSTREAVDTAMLARFYERYADHCVAVAGRIVYLATGLAPEEYLANKKQEDSEAELRARFAALERQFRHGDPSR